MSTFCGFQPEEGHSRGLLCDCEITVKLCWYLELCWIQCQVKLEIWRRTPCEMLSCVMNLQAADYANWKLQQLICTLQTDPQSEGRPTSCNIHSKPLEYNTWFNPNILARNWHWHKTENHLLMHCQLHNIEKDLNFLSYLVCLRDTKTWTLSAT